MQKVDKKLVQQAKMVLDFNWTGEYTMPGPRLYPHQWSWDSALIAIGYSRYVQDRAVRELSHLFESQWTSRLLPQIVINPLFGEYFPGMKFWHAERSPTRLQDLRCHPTARSRNGGAVGLPTRRRQGSGRRVSQTRLPQATGLARLPSPVTRPRGRGFSLHPPPLGVGHGQLPDVGSDHGAHTATPRPDPAAPACGHTLRSCRGSPLDAAYDRLAYLVKLFADRDYDEAKIWQDCPFLVQDVQFNALLCQAEKDLAQIARALSEDPSPFEQRAKKTAHAMNEKLWDEEHSTYLDFDLTSNRLLEVYVAPNFVPLYAGIADEERARHMVDSLEYTGFGLSDESLTPVPS